MTAEPFDSKEAEFIRIIAEGGTWRMVCDRLKVSSATLAKWLTESPELEKQYARAKEACADRLFDEILEIADDGRNDWMAAYGSEEAPGWRENGEAIRRSQIRIDARKWMAGKLRPKVYGDKITHEGNPDAPISTITRIELVAERVNRSD
jgi:hypothetical protein